MDNLSDPYLPRWARQATRTDTVEGALFAAAAALALLDPVVRVADPPGLLWRRRLALPAAAAVVALDGRREDLAMLRDLQALARPAEDPGPSGRLLMAWRLFAEPRELRPAEWPLRLPPLFELPPGALDGLPDRFRPAPTPLHQAARLAEEVMSAGTAHRGPALWLADAALAQGLGWERAVPLLAAHLPRSALRLEGEAWLTACALAWSRGALAARTLYAGLVPKAEALRRAAPKLRGRDAAAAVARLLAEDALAAHAGPRASDRAARRLFDRLVEKGLVRELTGRASFRLYGL